MRRRAACAILSLVLWLSAPNAFAAQQSTPPNTPEAAVDDSGSGDYCYGGKYESDDDINDGARITDAEIRRLLFPPTS